jgi:hypothetical protein
MELSGKPNATQEGALMNNEEGSTYWLMFVVDWELIVIEGSQRGVLLS